ncbi:hypothetical protein [Nocardioides sp.]|uniref:hypothetical protein n=1 Tax=Nocardioides sp. TaxID=35761 RepID=UPI003D0D0335
MLEYDGQQDQSDDRATLRLVARISYAVTIVPLVVFEQFTALPGTLVACATAHYVVTRRRDAS